MRLNSAEEILREACSDIPLQKIVLSELSKRKPFSLYEHSNEIMLFFEPARKGPSKLHVGFPFPLSTSDYDLEGQKVPEDIKIDFFIRGEQVRSLQRKQLQKRSRSYQEISSQSQFASMAESQIKGVQRMVYVDPFTFIGDSFINLYLHDSVQKKYGIWETSIFTRQHEHVSAVTSCHSYEPALVAKEVRDGDVVLMPDLIDTHWEKTLRTLEMLADRKVSVKVMIPGRNMFIDVSNGEMNSYHYNAGDVLLTGSNVEDYMQECLSPWGIQGAAVGGGKKFSSSYRFFINPFASAEARFIPAELVFSTYKHIKEASSKAEFHLIAGYHKNKSHTKWINTFLSLLKEDGSMRRVGINYYATLAELVEHLEEKECSCILTADTSVSHVANRLGYENVTVYNPRHWDADSMQSLAGGSPLGFCRYFPTQIPLLNASEVQKGASPGEVAAEAMLFFQKPHREQARIWRAGQAQWLEKIYDPDYLTARIRHNPNSGRFIEAAVKISPKYKLERME